MIQLWFLIRHQYGIQADEYHSMGLTIQNLELLYLSQENVSVHGAEVISAKAFADRV